jgi:hypothetical protein
LLVFPNGTSYNINTNSCSYFKGGEYKKLDRDLTNKSYELNSGEMDKQMKEFEVYGTMTVPVVIKVKALNEELAYEMASELENVVYDKNLMMKTLSGNVHKVQINDVDFEIEKIEEIEKAADLLGKTNSKK